MTEVERIARDAASLLEQVCALLRDVDERDFAEPVTALGAGSIGAQLRHCSDFWTCFLTGRATGRVDYDARERAPDLEHDPQRLVQRFDAVARQLRSLSGPPDGGLLVKLEGRDGGWTRSSVARELQFVASHTVHHLAIVTLLLRARGREVDTELGLAQSTREYTGAAAATS